MHSGQKRGRDVVRRMTPYFVLLTPDYDPRSEYAFPDRAGQLERAPRKPRG